MAAVPFCKNLPTEKKDRSRWKNRSMLTSLYVFNAQLQVCNTYAFNNTSNAYNCSEAKVKFPSEEKAKAFIETLEGTEVTAKVVAPRRKKVEPMGYGDDGKQFGQLES